MCPYCEISILIMALESLASVDDPWPAARVYVCATRRRTRLYHYQPISPRIRALSPSNGGQSYTSTLIGTSANSSSWTNGNLARFAPTTGPVPGQLSTVYRPAPSETRASNRQAISASLCSEERGESSGAARRFEKSISLGILFAPEQILFFSSRHTRAARQCPG